VGQIEIAKINEKLSLLRASDAFPPPRETPVRLPGAVGSSTRQTVFSDPSLVCEGPLTSHIRHLMSCQSCCCIHKTLPFLTAPKSCPLACPARETSQILAVRHNYYRQQYSSM